MFYQLFLQLHSRLLKSCQNGYLTKWSHVTEGPILNELIILAGVSQLGVALHGLGGQTDACGLAAGGVRRVQVVVALKDHKLTLSLGDVCGEGVQYVAIRHLHLRFQLCPCCQTGGQLYFIKLTTVWEQMRQRGGLDTSAY